MGVLILVLVEDGLGDIYISTFTKSAVSLNPCFSGGWSRSPFAPPFAGCAFTVLILVLVEDGLGVAYNLTVQQEKLGLNPCFSGGWSRRRRENIRPHGYTEVLILVLVEDGLGGELWRPRGDSPSLS